MAIDSYRELIAVERTSHNLTLNSLLNDNYNIQNLLSGFNIEEELSMALSEEKVSMAVKKRYISFLISWKILKEEMETNVWHFNTFKDFVNAKLDAKKDEIVYEKMFA